MAFGKRAFGRQRFGLLVFGLKEVLELIILEYLRRRILGFRFHSI